uniref:Chitinase n=1 Tax=Heterololigo bleekeri TaxID=1423826 RepID=A0A8E4DH55_HETBL|nr:chitinase [Heterololigo bleekeri]
MTMKIFCTLLLFLFVTSYTEATRRWCFYTNWAQYRKGNARFIPPNIDASLCTHISYAFASIKSGKLASFEWNDDDTPYLPGMYKQVNQMKQLNSDLKTLLSVGGWNMGSKQFSDVVATKETRQNFITSAIQFMRARNFDGLDICWEYPTKRGSPSQDQQNFGLLLKELRAAFEENAKKTQLPRLLLGIVVGSDDNLIENAYDINAINTSVDAVSILTYDFYSPSTTKFTIHTSPLHAGNITTGISGRRNVEYVANSWVENGISKELINIGIGLYGHSYHMEEAKQQGEGAAVSGPGSSGSSTGIPGFMAYFEICEMINNGATVTFMEERGVPYLVLGNQWVSYENEKSVTLKTKFAVNEGFGGVMVWSFDVDDFSGMCGGKKYPLLQSIYNAMQKSPTPDDNSIKDYCLSHGNGFFGISCTEFVVCSNGNGFKGQCKAGQRWNKEENTCADAKLVTCQ